MKFPTNIFPILFFREGLVVLPLRHGGARHTNLAPPKTFASSAWLGVFAGADRQLIQS